VRSLLLAVVALLAAPGAAGAQAVTGDYGGGAVGGDPARGYHGPGTVWLSAVANPGSARIAGAASLGCGLARFDARAALAADGSFSFTRVRRWRDGRTRLRAVVTVRGRFVGEAASGTVRARLRTRRGGRTARCSTGPERPWQLRIPVAGTPPGAPAPAATYHGLLAQIPDVPQPFVLRTSDDGTRVAIAIFAYQRTCRRSAPYFNNLTPGAAIAPDGSFRLRERFRVTYTDAVERFRVRVDGAFSATRVQGTLRVTSVARSRRTGRVTDRCDTGDVGFGAHL